MPVSRMRMRPWLEDRIESKSIAGLKWVDKDKKIFSIPWKHAARHGWEMDKDACLFKQWAIHTGKYKEGASNPDPKTWKANFRCAMNSLPDIEEVKDRSVNKGCGAVRVYRMLQAVSKKRDKKSSTNGRNKSRGSKTKVKVDNEDYEDSETSLDEDSMQENTVDSTQSNSESELSPSSYGNEEAVTTDWNSSLLISPDSTNDFFPNFQVSPLRSDFEDDEAVIIAMAQHLEQDQSQWQQCSMNGKELMSNEVGTVSTFSSPGSQWSDTSGEEQLELRFFTELKGRGADLVNYLDPWSASTTSYLSPIHCPI